jgi:alginate O-acetyltransferase complex protein AlgJ
VRVEPAVKRAGTALAKAYSSASVNFTDNNIRFAGETGQNGDYAVWAKKNEAFRKELADVIKAVPQSQMGFKGKDGWVFFRKDIDFLNAGDLNSQPAKTNPFPSLVEFNKFLKKRNIAMLFVAVPDKAEVYFEKLPRKSPSDALTIINPYSRKFLKDMQDSGIEVIDLLPLFLSAKNDDAKYKEGIYQKQDTHWTDRGLEIAAQAIAARIKQFGWYGEMSKGRVDYSVKDTFFERQGDIADKLAEADKALYPAVTLEAVQVYTPQGKLFTPGNPHAPILLMGDSFTGVFEIVDCKGAGVGAHIAEKTSLPVDIITSWGGGPLVREKMLRARQKNLSEKRVVVYMMVSRDLYNYSQGWSALELK